jgi:hypothetical protein
MDIKIVQLIAVKPIDVPTEVTPLISPTAHYMNFISGIMEKISDALFTHRILR